MEPTGAKIAGSDNRIVGRALRFIEKSYHLKKLNIQMIADELSVSSCWLSTLFKRETGQTLNGYITMLRIEKAKEIIAQGDYKVYEVADMVGYGSARYFSKVFSKVTAQIPSNYRE